VAQDSRSTSGDLVILSLYLITMTLFYFNIIMFLSISFLVYSTSIFDIVLIDNKFRHKFIERLVQLRIGLGGRSNVDVVSRLYLPANAPYFLGHVVDREGYFYSFIESSVVVTSQFFRNPKTTNKFFLQTCPCLVSAM
jgi:hypothetical protein